MRIDVRTNGPIVAVLALYFFVQPSLGMEIVAVFFACWIAGYLLDYSVTVRNNSLMAFESNLLFLFLYRRLGPRGALLAHLTIEASLVAVLPVLFTEDFGIAASSVVALTFGLSHVVAYTSNCRFVRRHHRDAG